jgi:hypothetical protein
VCPAWVGEIVPLDDRFHDRVGGGIEVAGDSIAHILIMIRVSGAWQPARL